MSSLDPVYTVGAQIVEVLTEARRRSRAPAQARAAELFELVGLSDRAARRLPAPVLRRHAPARGDRHGAGAEPSLLLADEPVTALDVIVQRQILDMLRSLQPRLNLSMVMVTHDISVVAYLCDEVVVMYAGQVVESGPVREVLARPRHPYTMGLRNAFPDLCRTRWSWCRSTAARPTCASRCPAAASRRAARSSSPPAPPATSTPTSPTTT